GEDARAQNVLAAVRDRPAAQELLQLRGGDETPREGERADDDLEVERGERYPVQRALVAEVLRDADEARRERAERVRERGPLRDGRHRDAQPHAAADDRADRETERDEAVIDDVRVKERADDGDEHTQSGERHAAT